MFRYTVQGRHPFPTDMLRYDRCYPRDDGSAAAIMLSIQHDVPGQRDTTYGVVLVSDKRPTTDRWSSFGWVVMRNSVVEEA